MVDFDPGQPELSALLLGIIYGATFCTLTCSPIIASYIIGQQQAEGLVSAPAHPAAELVQLCQSKAVRPFDKHDRAIGHVYADLNH